MLLAAIVRPLTGSGRVMVVSELRVSFLRAFMNSSWQEIFQRKATGIKHDPHQGGQ